MKKLIVVLVVLFIGILFAGCTSQPSTPAATPRQLQYPTTVATPVPTAMPTPVVTPNMTANVTAELTAVPTAAPTPQCRNNYLYPGSDHNSRWDPLCAGGNNRFLGKQ